MVRTYVLKSMVLKDIKVVNDPRHVKVGVLVGKLNSGVTYITTFRVVIVAPTGKHASCAVHRQHIKYKGRGLNQR